MHFDGSKMWRIYLDSNLQMLHQYTVHTACMWWHGKWPAGQTISDSQVLQENMVKK